MTSMVLGLQLKRPIFLGTSKDLIIFLAMSTPFQFIRFFFHQATNISHHFHQTQWLKTVQVHLQSCTTVEIFHLNTVQCTLRLGLGVKSQPGTVKCPLLDQQIQIVDNRLITSSGWKVCKEGTAPLASLAKATAVSSHFDSRVSSVNRGVLILSK